MKILIISLLFLGCSSTAENYIKDRPFLPTFLRESIRESKVIPMMTKDHVRASWGAPEKAKILKINGVDVIEIWTYPWQIVQFNKDGYVVNCYVHKRIGYRVWHD